MTSDEGLSRSEKTQLAFDILSKSADRSRSIIYFFIVINFSIFLAVFNYAAIQAPVFRLEKIVKLASCIEEKSKETECDIIKKNYDDIGINVEPLSRADVRNRQSLPFDAYLLTEIIVKRAGQLVESQIALNKYRFPIFGIEVEEASFWIITSFTGVVSLFVLNGALYRENQNFDFLRKNSDDEQFTRGIMVSTQMLVPRTTFFSTSSMPMIRAIQVLTLFGIIYTPIVSQIILLANGIFRSPTLSKIYTLRITFYEIFSLLISAIAFVAMVAIIINIHRNLRNQERNFEFSTS